jgi:hypothetical protein
MGNNKKTNERLNYFCKNFIVPGIYFVPGRIVF